MSDRRHIPMTRGMLSEIYEADHMGQNQEQQASGGDNLYTPAYMHEAGAAGGSGWQADRDFPRGEPENPITTSSQGSGSGSSVEALPADLTTRFYPGAVPEEYYLNTMDPERREQIRSQQVSDETAQRWIRQEEEKFKKEKLKKLKEEKERKKDKARADVWMKNKGWKDYWHKRSNY
jgi:hypothetical protein